MKNQYPLVSLFAILIFQHKFNIMQNKISIPKTVLFIIALGLFSCDKENEVQADLPLEMNAMEKASYVDFTGTVNTTSTYGTFSSLSCRVRNYPTYLYVYVPRKLDYNGKYTPAIKNGEIVLIDLSKSAWKLTTNTSTSKVWRLSTPNQDAASLYLPIIPGKLPQVFSMQVGTTISLSRLNSRQFSLVMQGVAKGSYSTNVRTTILF